MRLDSGEFGPWGTKAFIAGSYQNYDKFKGPGELEKKQFNAVIRQDFENENFISLAFHYNENRNAFYRTTSAANFATFGRDYDNLDVVHARLPRRPASSTTKTRARSPRIPGVLLNTDNPANPSSCTNFFGVRINPSNTGNIRMQSLWHLGENLRLTFDPSYQYTLANGGGTTTINETHRHIRRRRVRSAPSTLPASISTATATSSTPCASTRPTPRTRIARAPRRR